MRVDDTKNYKRDNPVSMTRRIQNTEFDSVATATQIILTTLPLYSQNATWRSSTSNTGAS